MWLLWGSVAVVTAGATAFVFSQARNPAASGGADGGRDPAVETEIKALKDLDKSLSDGLISEPDYQVQRAEIARRLLAEQGRSRSTSKISPKTGRLILMGSGLVAGVLAIGLYASLGKPNQPDQPFAARLAQWTQIAQAQPDQLRPDQLVAVLEQVKDKQKNDPAYWTFLGRAQTEAGAYMAAARSFEHVTKLRPQGAEGWNLLGQALTRMNEGKVSPEAKAAFEQALSLDPKAPAALYFLGLAELSAGNGTKGASYWKALKTSLPADDPRQGLLAQKLALVAAGRVDEALKDPEDDKRETAKAVAAARPEDRMAMISGMVEGLAAKLKANPDNPEGWVRLVRAYGVLGRTKDQDAAYQAATKRYANQPEILAALKAAKAPTQTQGN